MGMRLEAPRSDLAQSLTENGGLTDVALASQEVVSHTSSWSIFTRTPVSTWSCRKLCWAFLNRYQDLNGKVWTVAITYHLVMACFVVLLLVADPEDPTAGGIHSRPSECALCMIWTTEYLLRIWGCVEEAPLEYGSRTRRRCMLVLQPLMVLDALSVTCLLVDLFDIASLRWLSALRIFALFRLEREFNLFGPMLAVFMAKGQLLIGTISLAAMVLLLASVLMYYIETEHNPEFSSVPKAMWWCCAALTTVGYGDIYPETALGRVLGCFVAFLGLGLFSMPAGIIASGLQEVWEKTHHHHDSDADDLVSSLQLNADMKQRWALQQAQLDRIESEMAAMRADMKRILAFAGGSSPESAS